MARSVKWTEPMYSPGPELLPLLLLLLLGLHWKHLSSKCVS